MGVKPFGHMVYVRGFELNSYEFDYESSIHALNGENIVLKLCFTVILLSAESSFLRMLFKVNSVDSVYEPLCCWNIRLRVMPNMFAVELHSPCVPNVL